MTTIRRMQEDKRNNNRLSPWRLVTNNLTFKLLNKTVAAACSDAIVQNGWVAYYQEKGD